MQNPPQEWNLIKCFTPYNKLSEKLIRRSLMTAEFQQEDAEAKSSIDDLLAMPAMQRMNPGARGALSMYYAYRAVLDLRLPGRAHQDR